MQAVLVLAFAASAAATCEEWCGKNTCHLEEYCKGCTADNGICDKKRLCLATNCPVMEFKTPHRMCTQDSSAACGDKCTCDDYHVYDPPPSGPPPSPAIPPAPSPPPASPPMQCDESAMSSLKSKLTSMIATQQAKNLALQGMVYDSQHWPHMPPNPPNPPPPSPVRGQCVNLFGQCGGKNWGTPLSCCKGSCVYQNPWYSQCRED